MNNVAGLRLVSVDHRVGVRTRRAGFVFACCMAGAVRDRTTVKRVPLRKTTRVQPFERSFAAAVNRKHRRSSTPILAAPAIEPNGVAHVGQLRHSRSCQAGAQFGVPWNCPVPVTVKVEFG